MTGVRLTMNKPHLILILVFAGCCAYEHCNAPRLDQMMNGLLRSLKFMDLHKTKLNLDGLAGLRMTADQMAVLMENLHHTDFPGKNDLMRRFRYVEETSSNVVKTASSSVRDYRPKYFEDLSWMLVPGTWKLNYSLRSVDRSLQEKPAPCSENVWFEDISDICLTQVSSRSSEAPFRCNVSTECLELMTSRKMRDYPLTHEVLFLEVAEMHQCLPTLEEMGYDEARIANLRNYLCANALRDAEYISSKRYPPSHRDLFMEQIALCGMLGYSDFLNFTWVDDMLSWQKDNGCYTHSQVWICKDELEENRVTKRSDRLLAGKCSSHMTTVALAALAVNVRYCTEDIARQFAQTSPNY